MIVQIEKPYQEIINRMINYGFASDANEVVKQSLLMYIKQIEFEELFLVDKAVQSEMNDLSKKNEKFSSIDDVFAEVGT